VLHGSQVGLLRVQHEGDSDLLMDKLC